MVDLDEYRERVRQIRQYALDHDISEAQTTEIFQACFRQLEAKYSKSRLLKLLQLLCIVLLVISFVSLCLCNQRWLNDILVRLFQNSIYPGLYVLRKVAVPVISLYPSLSGL